jgi:hypothetical protein
MIDNQISTYALVFFIISLSGDLIAETIKRILRARAAFKTGQDRGEVKINPLILFSVIAIFDVVACVITTIFAKLPYWTLVFSPVAVFCTGVVGYEVIIKNFFDIIELLSTIIKRFIVGNKKEIIYDTRQLTGQQQDQQTVTDASQQIQSNIPQNYLGNITNAIQNGIQQTPNTTTQYPNDMGK